MVHAPAEFRSLAVTNDIRRELAATIVCAGIEAAAFRFGFLDMSVSVQRIARAGFATP
jgi:hypothetical protein